MNTYRKMIDILIKKRLARWCEGVKAILIIIMEDLNILATCVG